MERQTKNIAIRSKIRATIGNVAARRTTLLSVSRLPSRPSNMIGFGQYPTWFPGVKPIAPMSRTE